MMIEAVRRRPRSGLRTLLITVFVTLLPAALSAAPPETFELPEDGEVLRYQRVLGEFEHPDLGPEVILHADGRLHVRRPVYMKNPGLWQVRLEKSEMMTLLRDVVESGLVDAEVAELKARREGIEKRRREAAKNAGAEPLLFATGGPDTSVLRLNLASYRPAGDLTAAKSGAIQRSIEWSDLPIDAERFPEIRELVAFRNLELRMIQFIDMESLEKVSTDAIDGPAPAAKEVRP